MNLLNLEKMNWPKYDESQLIENNVKIVVQINGKKRGLIETNRDISEQDLSKIINNDKTLKKYLDNQTIKRKIFIKNKLMNIII
jgi:leucyl-tRNA synthetase